MKLPQLHLRDLFWLVLVCALAAGWWVDRNILSSAIVKLRSFVRSECNGYTAWNGTELIVRHK